MPNPTWTSDVPTHDRPELLRAAVAGVPVLAGLGARRRPDGGRPLWGAA